jgi:hypothetical protein
MEVLPNILPRLTAPGFERDVLRVGRRRDGAVNGREGWVEGVRRTIKGEKEDALPNVEGRIDTGELLILRRRCPIDGVEERLQIRRPINRRHVNVLRNRLLRQKVPPCLLHPLELSRPIRQEVEQRSELDDGSFARARETRNRPEVGVDAVSVEAGLDLVIVHGAGVDLHRRPAGDAVFLRVVEESGRLEETERNGGDAGLGEEAREIVDLVEGSLLTFEVDCGERRAERESIVRNSLRRRKKSRKRTG